jgi:uncharacterized protein (TIGR02246 family)
VLSLLLAASALALEPSAPTMTAGTSPVTPQSAIDLSRGDVAAINGVFKQWETTWNTHDPAAWARLFHENGTWVLWTGGVWKGRIAIEAGIREPFRSVYSDSTQLWQSPPELTLVAPDVVVARSISATTGDSRQPGVTIYGNKMLVLVRQNGLWKVLYGQNTRLNDDEIAKAFSTVQRP